MPDPQQIHLGRIGQISITVHDIDRAVVFYQDVLGMPLLFEAPPSMAFFDCHRIRLMLSLPERKEFDHRSSIIYYRVDDIIRTYDLMIDRDARFIAKPHKIADMETHERWMAFFYDPDVNILVLMSELPQ